MQRASRFIAAITLALLVAGPASAAVFQWSVPVSFERTTAKGIEKAESTAFLWIPADARQVRGVVYAGMTLMEKEFSKDPVIRKACEEQQLAIVFLKCGIGGPDTQKVLDDLAKVSGYRELSVAPLFFVGHSAGGPQAHAAAEKFASRCFGLVQYRGGGPHNGAPIADSIPTLAMLGEFDEFGGTMRRPTGNEAWENFCDQVADYRSKGEARLSSVVVEPGAGHFPWSQRNARYLAMFLAKAAHARIPEAWPVDLKQSPELRAIDPKTGWLTSLNIRKPGDHRAAAWADYAGDKATAAWHFDKEMAQATEAYHQGFEKKDQFIRWTDATSVDAGVRHFFNNLKWVGDGQTLEVHPVYADAYPANHPSGAGPKWSQAGQPVGKSKAPILVQPVAGPIVTHGPNTLRIQHDALSPATEGGRFTFIAYSEGDAEYRHTEQVGMANRGFKGIDSGKPQTISFPPMGNLKVGGSPVELKATSDSGLKVEYYVAQGPADVVAGNLVIRELPKRAAMPIAVKVVAYQFGSGVAPMVKTATPVEQTIQIEP